MKRLARWISGLTVVALLIVSVGVVAAAALLSPYAGETLDLSLLDMKSTGCPAVLYACRGEERFLGEWASYRPVGQVTTSGGSFVYVPLEDMPSELIHAFVAIEDKRFFEHEGVDLRRTAYAAFNYLTGGDSSFGGSTITQQLIKNLTERDEYTPRRKISEIFMSLDLERRVHKDEILTAYLNIINLANGCRGVGAAANRYFGKTVGELTVAQCACLAAITNNPSVYDPVTHPENNQRRRTIILGEMLGQGYITQGEYDLAVAEEISPLPPPAVEERVSSWYADMVATDVVRDLQTRLGYSYAKAYRTVFGGGVHIYTSMDEDLQSIVEKYYENKENFPVGEDGRPQSAMMVMDPRTGDILAVAGAVGQKSGARVQNYATDTRRPSGSAIKPLSVFAPALEQGEITWRSVYEDAPVTVTKGKSWPQNADGVYRGEVTVSDAMTHSLNTVAVRLIQRMGVGSAFDFLRNRLHMNSLKGAEGKRLNDETMASVALGQHSGGVTVRELTAGYTIFSEGVYHAPISYRKVVDSEGRVLLENRPSGEVVLSSANACVMTQMLRRVVTEGTAQSLRITDRLGVEAAGKTGTTQNNCDRWFVGYTPRLLAGVWMGYDYPTELKGIQGNPCLSVWDDIMTACEQAYEGAEPATSFPIHPDVIPLSFCIHTGKLPTWDCVSNGQADTVQEGWFVRGTEPKDFCAMHQPME